RLEAWVGAEVRRSPLPTLANALESRRRRLPLLLGRQALARPASEGVGLVPGNMEDGVGRVDRVATSHRRQHPPPGTVALPIHRGLGARVLHELEIRSIRRWGSIDLECGELDPVARTLVVVGETPRWGADLVLAARHEDRLR